MRDNPLEMTLEERKVDLVKRLFVSVADNDYLAARWAYSHALPEQFFWSSAQALEKYMKSLWLLNGKSIRKVNHDLLELFSETLRLDKSGVISTLIKLPETTAIGRDNWDGQSTQSFVEYLSYYGSSSSRYGVVGTHMNGPLIHVFDDLVASLRIVIRMHNSMFEDLYLETGQAQWPNKKIVEPESWVLCAKLPLEKLFYRTFSVGQSEELRSVFSAMNLAFFVDQDPLAKTFGGLIFHGSPLINHLIRWRNPTHFHLTPTQKNTETINQLKQWVFNNIPLSKEIKEVLNDPRYKDGVPDDAD